MELVQGENALDLENRFADFAKRNIGGNALEEDICSASDCMVNSMRTIDQLISLSLRENAEYDLPSGIAEEKMIAVMTKEMTGSQ